MWMQRRTTSPTAISSPSSSGSCGYSASAGGWTLTGMPCSSASRPCPETWSACVCVSTTRTMPDAAPLRLLEVLLDRVRRVDDDGVPGRLVADEVRGAAEVVVDELREDHDARRVAAASAISLEVADAGARATAPSVGDQRRARSAARTTATVLRLLGRARRPARIVNATGQRTSPPSGYRWRASSVTSPGSPVRLEHEREAVTVPAVTAASGPGRRGAVDALQPSRPAGGHGLHDRQPGRHGDRKPGHRPRARSFGARRRDGPALAGSTNVGTAVTCARAGAASASATATVSAEAARAAAQRPRWRAITMRCTSFVPSPISRIFWSR